ncbi:MAG: hypothetical protein M1544_02015 [Candidatus Marsarchaeota archaeon]|nr:hypothetical protein [Candidatus Marsarchaeota archaeon]
MLAVEIANMVYSQADTKLRQQYFTALKNAIANNVAYFIFIFVAMLLFYSYVFSYFDFGLILFGKYYVYYILLSAFTLSLLGSLSIVSGLYSSKASESTVGKNRKGIYAFIISLVPSTMCCTPVIPSVIFAAFGSGSMVLVSGAIQGTLSSFSPVFIVTAALLLVYSIFTSLKRKASPICKC